MRAVILTCLLTACAALPDEVSASGYSSRYDFLSGNSLKEGGSDVGEETGVMLTATYKLKPQSIRIVDPIRVVGQSPAALPQPEADLSGVDIDSLGGRVVGKLKQEASDAVDNLIDDALGKENPVGVWNKFNSILGDYADLFDTAVLALMVICCFLAIALLRRKK